MTSNYDAAIKLAEQRDQLLEILGELRQRNRLRNDSDAYELHLINWGIGEEDERPDPKDYSQ